MNKNSKVLVKRLTALCIATGLAFSVSVGGARVVSALSAPSFKWQTFTLPASSTIAREAVWTSNSTGVLSWKAFGGGCERKGESIVTYASGICKVRVWYTASKIHSAIDTERPHTVVPPVTVAPAPPVTPKPTVAPAPPVTPKPTVAPAPSFKFPFVPRLKCLSDCVVGDFGPGGGTVFYVAPKLFTSVGSNCGTKCKYLEVAKNAGTMGWCDRNLSATSVGQSDEGIGRGMANTVKAVWKKVGDKKCRTGAIKRAYDYSSKGQSDWFLPSRKELSEITRFVLLVLGADRPQGGKFLADRGLVFSLDPVDTLFWSSSEINKTHVWNALLGLNIERAWQKNESANAYVAFVRAF